MSKAVIYYSLTGNTKEAAKEIARKLGAKLFEIDLAKPLPRKPAAKMLVGGMQSTFGRIILGTPIWAGLPASPVNTFIKKYGVADRINAVFTLSGGGDNDRCLAQLSKKLKNLKSEVALADRHSDKAKDNPEKLEQFVKNIKSPHKTIHTA